MELSVEQMVEYEMSALYYGNMMWRKACEAVNGLLPEERKVLGRVTDNPYDPNDFFVQYVRDYVGGAFQWFEDLEEIYNNLANYLWSVEKAGRLDDVSFYLGEVFMVHQRAMSKVHVLVPDDKFPDFDAEQFEETVIKHLMGEF